MIASFLLSALAVNAAPTKRQDLGNTPGFLISFPVPQSSPYGASDLCLVTNPTGQTGVSDGTPAGFVDCHSVQTQLPNEPLYGLWNIQSGNQQGIQLVGTNLCLDAGSNPGSSPSSPGKVWTCYPGVPQQQFYYTDTNHIAVTGYTPCLDYSSSAGTNFVQCGSNSNNGDVQAFNIQAVGGSSVPSSSSSSVSATTTSTASASSSASGSSSSATPPSSSGRPLYFGQNDSNGNRRCLAVTNSAFYDGSPVSAVACTPSVNQMWTYNDSGVTSFQVAGKNYCLDFGSGGGSDGTAMKIWTCYPGLFQQTLYYTGDNHIAVYNGNQCLDVAAGTNSVQSWTCSGPDLQQIWQSA